MSSSLEVNKQIARDAIEALGRLDTEKFLSYMADDVDFETPGEHFIAGKKSKADLAAELPSMQQVIPGGVSFSLRSVTAEDDRVHIEGVGSARTIDGRPYNNTYHWALQIRDGKIIAFRDYFDSDLAARTFAQPAES